MPDIILEARNVADIKGRFLVPSYQRGYRWGKEEVTKLLDDVSENYDKNYCLQPICVKRNEGYFELIDGQQRLTTIFLLYKFIEKKFSGYLGCPLFSLEYETRRASAEFLASLDPARKEENIDFHFIYGAYRCIEDWFNEHVGQGDEREEITNLVTKIKNGFHDNIKVIWYEVDASEDGNRLFRNLNIGKIPLTSSELVKAMFLSHASKSSIELQHEISLQWDLMEKQLHDDSLWYFLTNKTSEPYKTRIDLVLDLMSKKRPGERNKYFTFFYFDNLSKEKELNSIWQEIHATFLRLKDWKENHELYHKIGYLLASDSKSLSEIYEASLHKRKSEFIEALNGFIKESVFIGENRNYADLSYDRSGDYDKLTRLLLLFNVESVRQAAEHTEWFPFEKFKIGKPGSKWSLEHIHAQQSEGLNTMVAKKEWLKLHRQSLESLEGKNDDLLKQIDTALEGDSIPQDKFENLHNQIVGFFFGPGDVEYMHSISNLALLNTADNAALNNATFDVKRNRIIEMDKNGQFIPFCTKMVFLKYYTPSRKNQLHFWGADDRVAYVKEINKVLKDYLPEPIQINERGKEDER